jgi:F-type H+-transporting ATPase subunit gamma
VKEVAGVRDIRRRIRSVRNMQQITRAMKMVAAAKLRRAQEKVIASRPYARQLQEVLTRLAMSAGEEFEQAQPLLKVRPVNRTAYLVVSSDRGLCGGFNANLLRMTSSVISKQKTDVGLVTVGRKSRDYFRRRKLDIIESFVGLGDNPNYQQAKRIAGRIIKLYENSEVDEVYLVYSEFINAITQQPTMVKLLPIERPEGEHPDKRDYIFEPTPTAILSSLLPRYTETLVYRAILESKASEHGARMTAMGSATDNAKEMISSLTLAMNRARQAAITTEISEIVGGAAALE